MPFPEQLKAREEEEILNRSNFMALSQINLSRYRFSEVHQVTQLIVCKISRTVQLSTDIKLSMQLRTMDRLIFLISLDIFNLTVTSISLPRQRWRYCKEYLISRKKLFQLGDIPAGGRQRRQHRGKQA